MDKQKLLQLIIAQLTRELDLFFTAAKSAHQAATHEQNIPDNKYDTLALEASYVAQGQANRAQELRQSIEIYKQLSLVVDEEVVRLTSLVTIRAENGAGKVLFIGPLEGGLRISDRDGEVMLITPASPLGKELIGRSVGDTIMISTGSSRVEYTIQAVC